MKKVKTISVAVTDLANLLTINDPEARKAAFDAILAAADAPDTLPEQSSGIAGPILDRIRRKAIAQEKAKAKAEARRVRKAEEANEAGPSVPSAPKHISGAAFSEALARRLLRLKMTMGETFDNIIYIMQQFSSIAPQFLPEVRKCQQMFDHFRRWFAPMIKFAGDYMRIPRSRRQGISMSLDY